MGKKDKTNSPTSTPSITTGFPLTWDTTIKTVKEMVQCTRRLDLKQIGQRTGDVVVLTGGARGIGEIVTKKLLQCDFHIVMGIRNLEAGEKVLSNFRDEGIATGKITFIQLDLKSLKSVREFANSVLHAVTKINILICNAGIMFTPYELTEDGFESQFQVDYLSHFLLTELLLPKMIESAKNNEKAGRIVNVSSAANWSGTIKDISQIETRSTEYNMYKAYCDAKLAQVAASNYLDMKLSGAKTNVNAYSLHPGAIPTELGAHVMKPPSFLKKLMRTTEDGADVIVCAAASPEFEKKGGIFLMNCKIETPNAEAADEGLQKQLWEKSLKLLGIKEQIY